MPNIINEKFFFDYVRVNLFDGKISASQLSGMKAILDLWSNHHSNEDDRFLAYMLATAHHETGRTMQPIKEWGGDKYFFRMYDIEGDRPKVAKTLGNIHHGDGVLFCGRGYVQLTGRANYTKWATILGVNLVQEPRLALDEKIAARILVEGMLKGSFTGKKLAEYFSSAKADWPGARRIINGTDKAQIIASYALKYYAAISYTT